MIVITPEMVKEDQMPVFQSGDNKVVVSVQWWASVSDSEKKQVIDNCRRALALGHDSPFSLPDAMD